MEPRELYELAHYTAYEAATGHTPTPMLVGTAKDIFSDEIDRSQPCYVVNEGLCGFGWVNIKPANSKFCKYLLENEIARKDSYYGGVSIWVHQFNQSYERKKKYAEEFAKVLKENGIKKVQAGSRLD